MSELLDDNKMPKLTGWDKLVKDMDDIHADRFNAMLCTCDEEQFAINYTKLLEYTKPKLQRTVMIDESEPPLIRVEHVKSKK